MNIFGRRENAKSLSEVQRRDLPIYRAWAEIICCQTLSQILLDDIAHEQTIICRQLTEERAESPPRDLQITACK